MKLERQNRSKEDVVSKEIFYMIKRVSIFNNEKSIDDFLFFSIIKKGVCQTEEGRLHGGGGGSDELHLGSFQFHQELGSSASTYTN